MQIIHSVVANDDECLALLDLGKAVLDIEKSVAYSPEEKLAATVETIGKFKLLLGSYLHEAFSYGYNEGSHNANAKDTEMYKPLSPFSL